MFQSAHIAIQKKKKKMYNMFLHEFVYLDLAVAQFKRIVKKTIMAARVVLHGTEFDAFQCCIYLL